MLAKGIGARVFGARVRDMLLISSLHVVADALAGVLSASLGLSRSGVADANDVAVTIDIASS